MNVWLQKLASIQQGTDTDKFAVRLGLASPDLGSFSMAVFGTASVIILLSLLSLYLSRLLLLLLLRRLLHTAHTQSFVFVLKNVH